MGRLKWDEAGEKRFEMGVDQGVLYPVENGTYQAGVAWNGLTSVSASPEGGDANDLWADNIKYGSMRGAEKFGGTIEAYQAPDEFKACDGRATLAPGLTIAQQTRKSFGFCWRSKIGNDLNADAGSIIHIAYGCTASPSEQTYETMNDSPDAGTLSWEFEANTVSVTGHKGTALVEIDSTKVGTNAFKAIEDKLYGTDASNGKEATNPELLLPDAILALIQANPDT